MRKIKPYIETSPIIRVNNNEAPLRQAITKEFFRIVAEFKKRTANLKPDYDRFPFLAPKKTQ